MPPNLEDDPKIRNEKRSKCPNHKTPSQSQTRRKGSSQKGRGDIFAMQGGANLAPPVNPLPPPF